MTFLIISGTGTEVGKTVVTAAIAANALHAGHRVAVVKPAQTGASASEPGDLDEVRRLTGVEKTFEFARFLSPLSPAAAARVSSLPELDLKGHAADLQALDDEHDLVLVEGAGGLLVRFDDTPTTVADLAKWLEAPVLLVVHPSLGTLNHTELTVSHLKSQNIECQGVVIGSWPTQPDLAMRSNVRDLELISGRSLRGALPANSARHQVTPFSRVAQASLDPALGGTFDAGAFRRAQDPAQQKEVR